MTSLHTERSKTVRELWFAATTVAAAAVAVAAGVLATGDAAIASVPTAAPTFSTPTAFSNTFFPFVPGAVKLFRGQSEGARVTDLDLYLAATRDFVLGAATVTCRALDEYAFEDGELVEISRNYFAQADDGSVYYFGETVDNYENGQIADHGGSWLVGGPVGNDPPGTETVAAPALFMPANPEVGDEFVPEDLPSGAKEVDTIRRVGVKLKTPGHKYTGCIEVREFSPQTSERETKWYAPRIGVIKAVGKREVAVIDSTTLR